MSTLDVSYAAAWQSTWTCTSAAPAPPLPSSSWNCGWLLFSIVVIGDSSAATNLSFPSIDTAPRWMMYGTCAFCVVNTASSSRLMVTSPSATVFTSVPPAAGPPMPSLPRHDGIGVTVDGADVGVTPATDDGQERPLAS